MPRPIDPTYATHAPDQRPHPIQYKLTIVNRTGRHLFLRGQTFKSVGEHDLPNNWQDDATSEAGTVYFTIWDAKTREFLNWEPVVINADTVYAPMVPMRKRSDGPGPLSDGPSPMGDGPTPLKPPHYASSADN